MSSTYEHPSLGLHVTPEQRERAEHWLAQAYAEGRISEEEFDARIDQVLSAQSRRDLNAAFYGLVPVPAAPAASTAIVPRQGSHLAAALAHFSALFTWLIGPGLFYLLAPSDTDTKREAAKAFNFQLVATLAFIAVGIVAAVIPGDGFNPILGLMWVGWLVLTIVGGIKAARGDGWHNPVTRVAKLKVLPEK